MNIKNKLEDYIENKVFINSDDIELKNKDKYEQFYTPDNVANYMASMFNDYNKSSIEILDAGGGLGSLTYNLVMNLIQRSSVKKIKVIIYEIDDTIIPYLEKNMYKLQDICNRNKVNLNVDIKNEDFIYESIKGIRKGNSSKFDYVIMNPPYKKMHNGSMHKLELKNIGLDVSNYYAAFVLLGCKLLKSKGEIVAITPRSFCNGAYFNKFREELLNNVYFNKIHLFESRKDVFNKENILQETIIYHCIKDKLKNNLKVQVYHSSDSIFNDLEREEVLHKDLIYGKNLVVRVSKSEEDKEIIQNMMRLRNTLEDIGIEVSTGPIVDFREDVNVLYRDEDIQGLSPLIYPEHIMNREIIWPVNDFKKYNFILENDTNHNRLRPNGNYVLVKRMSSKEEKRRIVSAIYEFIDNNIESVGFDNKLNYYHQNREGMDINLAKGLCIYLNSTFVDLYFRTFSGSTQVNVGDLKMLRYPSIDILMELGQFYENVLSNQDNIDELIETIVFN
ncbi:MAG: Eco57I restriction-modification methylase domain-containing protein [Paraclostridium sordellii]